MADNQFAPGSMLPKFEAGISFIEKGDNRRTIITDIAHAKDGYFEKTGTIIKYSIAILVNNAFKRIAIFYLTIQKDIYQSNTYHLAGICLLIIIL